MESKSERDMVDLTESERGFFDRVDLQRWQVPSVLSRARILLKADEGKTDSQNAEFSGTSLSTVFRVRRRFVKDGLEAAMFRKNTGKRIYRKLDGTAEATLIAIA